MQRTSVSGKCILIVDDDFDIRDMLTEVLQDEGYRAVTAAHGAEALDFLRGNPDRPDLILLDLMMPVMNGWELHAEMQKDPALASIPIVVISAMGRDPSIAAAGHINKPVQLKTLLNTVAAAIE